MYIEDTKVMNCKNIRNSYFVNLNLKKILEVISFTVQSFIFYDFYSCENVNIFLAYLIIIYKHFLNIILMIKISLRMIYHFRWKN